LGGRFLKFRCSCFESISHFPIKDVESASRGTVGLLKVFLIVRKFPNSPVVREFTILKNSDSLFQKNFIFKLADLAGTFLIPPRRI